MPTSAAGSRRAIPNANERGFTLVELMVVVVIIGLLATIVALNVLPSGDTARVQKAKADIATIEDALELYKLQNISYPTTSQGLAALSAAPAGLADPFVPPARHEHPLVQPLARVAERCLEAEALAGAEAVERDREELHLCSRHGSLLLVQPAGSTPTRSAGCAAVAGAATSRRAASTGPRASTESRPTSPPKT